jgi:hypothetical protein
MEIGLLQLQSIAQGQKERNIVDSSKSSYLSLVRTITTKCSTNTELKELALQLDEAGEPLMHSGMAAGICKMKFPISSQTAECIFALLSVDTSLTKKRRRNDGNDAILDTSNSLNPAANCPTMSAQTYGNYRSALKWWHSYECPNMDKVGFIWPEELNTVLRNSINSYRRDVAVKKRSGIMKNKEGKSPYNLAGYIELNRRMGEMEPNAKRMTWDEGMFASLFTVLSVNTIGRSDNIEDLLINNIGWMNDALTISFGYTKSDQIGETTASIKRIYANPFRPEICAILKLSVYIFCIRRTAIPKEIDNTANETSKSTDDINNTMRLFEGVAQNKRYYNILQEVVKTIPDDFDIGCSKEDIGTHSNRKFAESTSVSRIDGPSKTQVCLRAGQSVGRIQDCYMFAEEDGDALVGRTVAQLSFSADQFDVLPPHFSNAGMQIINEVGMSVFVPDYDHYPKSFKRVVPFLMASLLFHYNNGNLHKLYPVNHPIFSQPIITNANLRNRLKEHIILAFSQCKESAMYATGIPAVITISRELRNFKSEYNTTLDNTARRIEELETKLTTAIDSQPEAIVRLILERFQVQGVVPITVNDIRTCIAEALNCPDGPLTSISQTLHAHGKALKNLSSNGGDHSSPTLNSSTPDGALSNGNVHYWPGDGRMHRVPKGFKFPSYSVGTMFNLWFFGNQSIAVSAYMFIVPAVDLSKSCGVNHSRCRQVMRKLVEISIKGKIIKSISEIKTSNAQQVFDYAYPKLLEEVYTDIPTRQGSININTIANRLYK